ncbi:hypothetical protein C8R34_1391 [Nitrosomonas sp. Nm84]|nr:hypothetical protein C8R34_1391 [Nitrosomonas sp. Nm84]
MCIHIVSINTRMICIKVSYQIVVTELKKIFIITDRNIVVNAVKLKVCSVKCCFIIF